MGLIVLCWSVLQTPDMTSLNITGCTIYYTAGARQIMRSLLFPGTFSHTWVSSSLCIVLSVTCISDFVINNVLTIISLLISFIY